MEEQGEGHTEHSSTEHLSHRHARIEKEGGAQGLVAYFKERVYATFTGLAIVLVAGGSAHDPEHAFLALVFGVLGIVAAGFVADVIAHLVVHGSFSHAGELLLPLRIALSALSTVAIPAAVMATAWIGWMHLDVAATIAAWVYVAVLAVTGLLAVRRHGLTLTQRLVSLALLMALAVGVLALQILAKSV